MKSRIGNTEIDFHVSEYVHKVAWGYRLKVDRIADVGIDISLTPQEAIALFKQMREAIGFKFPDVVLDQSPFPISSSLAAPTSTSPD